MRTAVLRTSIGYLGINGNTNSMFRSDLLARLTGKAGDDDRKGTDCTGAGECRGDRLRISGATADGGGRGGSGGAAVGGGGQGGAGGGAACQAIIPGDGTMTWDDNGNAECGTITRPDG